MRCRIIAIFIVVSLAIVMNSGCSDPTDWYPEGSVEMLDYYEFSDGIYKELCVSVRIDNEKDAPIVITTFTISFQTDVRPYWLSVTDSTRIMSKGAITLTIPIAYRDQAESLVPETLAIVDTYFE